MNFLIVDDHPLILAALHIGLSNSSIQCLTASSIKEAHEIIERHQHIDLIILDINLPDSHGIEGFIAMRVALPAIPVIVLSGTDNWPTIKQALGFGAAGFIPKSIGLEETRRAIKSVLDGEIYVPPNLKAIINAAIPDATHCHDNLISTLTEREKSLLPFVALGLSNKTIAKRISVAEATVRLHVSRILKKTNVTSRTQLASKILTNSAANVKSSEDH